MTEKIKETFNKLNLLFKEAIKAGERMVGIKNIPVEYLGLIINSIEKQVPQKPNEKESTEKIHYRCSSCKFITLTVYADGYKLGNAPKYCEKCGQAFDWSEVEEC